MESATKMPLPTAADERQDAQATDRRYEAAIRALITKTRDRPRFELVFKENQGYGYWRNLLGVRSMGIAVAVGSVVVLLALLACQIAFGLGLNLLDLCLGIAACTIGVAFWIWVPTEERVKRAAISYAERLLDAAALAQ